MRNLSEVLSRLIDVGGIVTFRRWRDGGSIYTEVALGDGRKVVRATDIAMTEAIRVDLLALDLDAAIRVADSYAMESQP